MTIAVPDLIIVIYVCSWAVFALANRDRTKSFALALLWPIAVPFFALLILYGGARDLLRAIRRYFTRPRSHGL